MAAQPYSESPPHQKNSDTDASILSEYSWMDFIVCGRQEDHPAGVPSSSTPTPVPPPPPPRLAPSGDQYHASPAPSPPPPPPPPAPRPSVHPSHADQNSTNVHAESSTTSNGNLVGGSLMLEFLAAYQQFEDRRKISDLVEEKKSLEKKLDSVNKEIETRTRRLKEMESPHSARRRLDFAPPPLRPPTPPQHYVPSPPPPPRPERLWHYNPSPPPSVAPQHLWQHTIPNPPPLPPPPNRSLKRGNTGVLDNILKRQSFD